jgi:hypothetical protein
MGGRFFEGARAEMTMKAFAVVIWCIQPDGRWRRRFAKILHVYVAYAPPFGTYATAEHVVGVARLAGFVGGNAMILEMSRSEIMVV